MTVGAVVVKMVDGLWVSVPDLAADLPGDTDLRLLDQLVRTSGSVQILAGKTNKLGALEGNQGPSYYLSTSARKLGGFLKSALGEGALQERDEEDPVFALRFSDHDLLLLGGPVSNDLAAYVSGHSFEAIHKDGREVRLPVFTGQPSLRWGFFCGDGDFGRLEGEYLSGRRFDRGEEVVRPLYGLVDRNEGGALQLFPLGADGFVRQEALLIARVRNPFDRSRFVATVGGVHGYSSLAFAADLPTNLEALNDLARGVEEYQALVPVTLEHDAQLKETFGVLHWENARVHRIGQDRST